MTYVNDMADCVVPPEADLICCIAVDATSQKYDLGDLNLGTLGASVKDASNSDPRAGENNDEVYVTLRGSVDFHYFFYKDNTKTIDPSVQNAVGASPLVFTANTSFGPVPAGQQEPLMINRRRHRFIYLRTASGSGQVRIYASSQPNPGAKPVP